MLTTVATAVAGPQALLPNMNTLSRHQLKGHEVFYVPDFVTPEEEEYLIRKITESPQQKWKQLTNRRLQLCGGEITPKNVLLAQPMPSFIDHYPDIIARLRDTGAFESSPHGAPNHVILNEYLPGQGIMPHEDGPTYHPVVATISLGSHAVFHYYQYKGSALPAPLSPSFAPAEEGRVINSTPVLSVILERRSLIISSGSMYTSHLHGIRETRQDLVTPGQLGLPPILTDLGVEIANWEMLAGKEVKRAVKEGGALERGVRFSLTCRDVKRVSSTGSFLRR